MEARPRDPLSVGSRLLLCLAQGCWIGRIPLAPGTFGSLLGTLWFAVLIFAGSLWLYLAGVVAGFAISVWTCGAAEKILREKDPPSVVLDEIVAMPVCFLPWVVHYLQRHQWMPSIEEFFSARTWHFTLAVFILFRAFDILKPWPVRQSQKLPGGLGVTVDDFLAAAYVALIATAILFRR
jgi:phosphatidylglycerophosphatase A